MSEKIQRLLVDERLVRTPTEATRVVNGWLLNATSTDWEEDRERLARLVGGREKAIRITNRLCEVIR